MYCMNCGVKLGEGEHSCPLCGVRAYHPDLEHTPGTPLFPRQWSAPKPERTGWRFLLTITFLAAFICCLAVDLLISHGISWSGYVMAGLQAGYILLVLPMWFPHPNWLIFLPIDVVTAELLLLYINCASGGRWFLSFAFPVTAIYGGLIIGVTALVKFMQKGWFFLSGGVCIVFGCSTMLLELFQHITFHTRMFLWSLYPTGVLSLLGVFWILCGIIRPLGDAIRKRTFL